MKKELENKVATEEEIVPNVATEEEAAPIIGTVANCVRLNVRKYASKNADILTEIYAGNKVTIDPKKSRKEWYKVVTASGVEGFCMKEYIEV